MSDSLWMSRTGADRSVRKIAGGPPMAEAMPAAWPGAASGRGDAPRLCTKNPSNSLVRGCTPS